MTNKANIQTKINTIDNGGNNTAAEVRDVFGTHQNSLLEAIYSSSVDDTHTDETYTSSNSNFDYSITFRKVGSSVILTGSFTANILITGVSATIFEITNSDLLPETGSFFYTSAVDLLSSDTVPLDLGDRLMTSVTILSGETYNFTIKYNTQN